MNIEEAIKILLEKETETSHYIQSQLDIANAKLAEEKEKNKELESINFRVNKNLLEVAEQLEKEKEKNKEFRKYIEKYKIRIPMPEEYCNRENWGEEITIAQKEYIAVDKIKAKIEELENEHTGSTHNVFSVLQSLLKEE